MNGLDFKVNKSVFVVLFISLGVLENHLDFKVWDMQGAIPKLPLHKLHQFLKPHAQIQIVFVHVALKIDKVCARATLG